MPEPIPIDLNNISVNHYRILTDTGKVPVLLIKNRSGDESDKSTGIWDLTIVLDNDKPTQEVVGSTYATGCNVFSEAYSGDYFRTHLVAKLECLIETWSQQRIDDEVREIIRPYTN